MSTYVSRSKRESIGADATGAVYANFTHIRDLRGLTPFVTSVQAAHCRLTTLRGAEETLRLKYLYAPFNFIEEFCDGLTDLTIGVLDLSGNPLKSLEGCPQIDTLQVPATLLRSLDGINPACRIVRCGHSDTLRDIGALLKCPSLELVNVADAPALDCAPLAALRKRGVEVLVDDPRVHGPSRL